MRIHIFVAEEQIHEYLKKKFLNREVTPFTTDETAIMEAIATTASSPNIVAIVDKKLSFRDELIAVLDQFEIPVVHYENDFNQVIRDVFSHVPVENETEDSEELFDKILSSQPKKLTMMQKIKTVWYKQGNISKSKADSSNHQTSTTKKSRKETERLESRRKAVEEAKRREDEVSATKEAERLEAEETERLEAERKAAEEAERLESERRAAKEAKRLEAERKAAEETERLEAERKAAEEVEQLESERRVAKEAEYNKSQEQVHQESPPKNESVSYNGTIERNFNENILHSNMSMESLSDDFTVHTSPHQRFGTLTIAVGGFGRRTGSSFRSLQISTYLKSCRLKVACVELATPYHSYKYFLQNDSQYADRIGGYKKNDVILYPNWSPDRLYEIYGVGYDVILLDCGNLIDIGDKGDFEKNPTTIEFFKADKSIITTFAAFWDQATFIQLLLAFKYWGWSKNLTVFAAVNETSSNEDLKEYLRQNKGFRTNYFSSTLSDDPFNLSDPLKKEVEKMLYDALPDKKGKNMFSFLGRRKP